MGKLKINITPSLQKLDLIVKGFSNSKYIGSYQSVFKGQGFEFANFRAYSPSDDASRIDWKTSARSDQIVVKEFVEERNVDVFFLVDVSSRMTLGSSKRLKAEYAADLVASLTYIMLRAGDRVGLTMFSEGVKKTVYPQKGIRQLHAITEALGNLSFYGGGTDFKEVIKHAMHTVSKGSIVFFISDFITEQNLENLFGVMAYKFDTIAAVVRDPLDISLPDGMGQVLVQDPVTGERMLVSPREISRYYALDSQSELRKLKKIFSKSNMDVMELDTSVPFVKRVTEFFERRKAKWR